MDSFGKEGMFSSNEILKKALAVESKGLTGPSTKDKQAHAKGAWDVTLPVTEREIPQYSAEKDKFCKYTKSNAFKDSPYYRLRMAQRAKKQERLMKLIGIPKGTSTYAGHCSNSLGPDRFHNQHFLKGGTKKRPRTIIHGPQGHDPRAVFNGRIGSQRSALAIKEMHAMKLVFLREGLVDELEHKFAKIRKRIKQGIKNGKWDSVGLDAHLHASGSVILSTLDELRVRTVEVIEAIKDWRAELKNDKSEEEKHDVTPFMWQQCNYLLKITVDTGFLSQSFVLADDPKEKSILRTLGLASVRNPLFTSVCLDELAFRKKNYEKQNEGLEEDSETSTFPLAFTEDTDVGVSDSRLVDAAVELLDEENEFGRLAPLEHCYYNEDTLNTEDSFFPDFKPPEHGEDPSTPPRFKVNDGRCRDDLDCLPNSRESQGNRDWQHVSTEKAGLLCIERAGSSRASSRFGFQREDTPVQADTGFISVRLRHLVELARKPSELTQGILGAVRVLVLNPKEPIPPRSEFQWKRLSEHLLANPMKLLQQLASFSASRFVTVSKAKFLQPIFKDERFDPARIRPHSEAAALLCSWCLINASKYVLSPELCQDYNDHVRVEQSDFGDEIASLRNELRALSQQVSSGALLNNFVNNATGENKTIEITSPSSDAHADYALLQQALEQVKQLQASAQALGESQPTLPVPRNNGTSNPVSEPPLVSPSKTNIDAAAVEKEAHSAFVENAQYFLAEASNQSDELVLWDKANPSETPKVISSQMIEQETGASLRTTSRGGSRKQKRQLLDKAVALSRTHSRPVTTESNREHAFVMWKGGTCANGTPLLWVTRRSLTPRGIDFLIFDGARNLQVFLSDAEVNAFLALMSSKRVYRRGLYDTLYSSELCKHLTKHICYQDGIAFVDRQVPLEHPTYGFDISGMLVHLNISISSTGNIDIKGAELKGIQTVHTLPLNVERPHEISITPLEFQLLSFPSVLGLVKKLRFSWTESSLLTDDVIQEVAENQSEEGMSYLHVAPIIFESAHRFVSGIESSFILETKDGGKGIRITSTTVEGLQIRREMDIEELFSIIGEDQKDSFGQLKFERLFDSMMLLPWPVAPSGYRIEFGNWNETGLKLNVSIHGETEENSFVGEILLGPRSTLYDARMRIERAAFPLLNGGTKFKFQECEKRKREVGTLAFDFYPTLVVTIVDEFSSEEGEASETENEAAKEDETVPSNAGGKDKRKRKSLVNVIARQSRKSTTTKKKRSSRASGGKKRDARKSRKSGAIRSRMNRRSAKLKLKAAEEEELKRRQEEEAKAEEERIAREKKEAAEAQRKREEIFFEDIVELPGFVSVKVGEQVLETSESWASYVHRGDLLEVDGTRCIVSEDISKPYHPGVVPLSVPFVPKDLDLDDEDENGGGINAEHTLAKLEPVERMTGLEGFIIKRLPARAVEIKGILVSVTEGSSIIGTSADLRFKVRPGDTLRIDEWNFVKISSAPQAKCSSSELTIESPYDGSSGRQLRVDKVIFNANQQAKKNEARAEKARAEFEEAYQKSKMERLLKKNETFFGFKVSWREILPYLGMPGHHRAQDYWFRVPRELILSHTYKYICEIWSPATDSMDGTKFSKFIKDLPGVMTDGCKISSIELDLTFAKSKSKGDRRISQELLFESALPRIAAMKYPDVPEDEATALFFERHVYQWRDFLNLMWDEAKRLALVDEAKQICGARKIQCAYRSKSKRKWYQQTKQSSLLIQKRFKSFRQRKTFRIQISDVRKYKNLKQQEAKALRKAKKKSRVSAGVRLIGGVKNIVTVFRHAKGSVLINCYNPVDCVKYKFCVTLDDLRLAIENDTNISNLMDHQLYEEKYLRVLLQRLQYRKRVGQEVIVIGRKMKKDSGTNLLVQGKFIRCTDKTKVMHIVNVTEARRELTFQAYNPETGETKSVNLTRRSLFRWFDFDEEKESTLPHLLKPENQPELLQWLLDHMLICTACALLKHQGMHRRGENVLMLECEVAEQREHNMAARLQSMWRIRKSRENVYLLISRAYRKQWDPETSRWYYLRYDTGEVSWVKPKLLRHLDLPDPPDKWEESVSPDGSKYYYHPLTGRTSWMSEYQAATVIQKLYRKKQAKEFTIEFTDMIKAVSFQRKTETNYEKFPDRLASLANFALLVHTRDHDHARAKTLYAKALDLAPNSPLLLYAIGVFDLCNNVYPRKGTFNKAHDMINRAKQLDPKFEKFDAACKAFFFWAVLSQPNNSYSWLNYAIVQQSIYGNFEKAEKYYRKAIDLDPNNESAIDNYDDFLENRLPKGRFAGGGPKDNVRKRSIVISKDGEWHEMRDPEAKHDGFAKFWFNEITQISVWAEPNWEMVWIERRKRSELVDEAQGWSQFHDSAMKAYFYYRLDTGKAQWDMPEDAKFVDSYKSNNE